MHLFVLSMLFLKQHIANTDSFWAILIKSLVADNKEKTFYHFLNGKYLHLAGRKVNHLSMYDWSLRCSLNWIFPGKQNFWVKKSSKMGQKNLILYFFASIINVLSLQRVMSAKCLHSFFRFSKYFLFSSLMSWCNSWGNSYTKCFIWNIKFCFTSDESNLYLNFVQVQNIIIKIVDLVFTFVYAFVYCYHSHSIVHSVVFSIKNAF